MVILITGSCYILCYVLPSITRIVIFMGNNCNLSRVSYNGQWPNMLVVGSVTSLKYFLYLMIKTLPMKGAKFFLILKISLSLSFYIFVCIWYLVPVCSSGHVALCIYISRNSPSYRQSIYVLLRINSYSRIVVVHHGAPHNCGPTTIKDFEFQPIRRRKLAVYWQKSA